MVTLHDLKNVPFFSDADDEVLEAILSITRLETFQSDEVVYDENSEGENFYVLKSGKAILEADLTADISVSLASVKPAYVFGLYALIPGSVHSMRAICTEPCDILVINGRELRDLLEKYQPFGFHFMSRLFNLLKNRLDRRTSQFIRILQRHPDLNISEE